MDLRVYLLGFPKAFIRDLSRNMGNKSAMDIKFWFFLLFPEGVKRIGGVKWTSNHL